MDGFKRPPIRSSASAVPSKNRTAASVPAARSQSHPAAAPQKTPVEVELPRIAEPSSDKHAPKQPHKRKRSLLFAVSAALVVLGLLVWAAAYWYNSQLEAVDAKSQDTVRFEVKEGTGFAEVTQQLHQRGLIRNEGAFSFYARLNNKQRIQASTCSLTKSLSAAAILDRLIAGCHDFVSMTFYPGATLEKPRYKPDHATIDQDQMYIKGRFLAAGYSVEQIEAAFQKQYTDALFADKPSGTSLEGYVFGETYYVSKDATVEEILKETFAHMQSVIQKNDIEKKFRAQGLTLYQGITLASIVQRELNCEGKPTEERKQRCYTYQQSIAQVFLKRYKEGISLGSDVTFIYAADQLNVYPSVDLESPYNTRNRVGLPPGPIASPGELALKAVANPSQTDFLYFIAGDDGLIYFAKDLAGHETNIQKHCQQLCAEL